MPSSASATSGETGARAGSGGFDWGPGPLLRLGPGPQGAELAVNGLGCHAGLLLEGARRDAGGPRCMLEPIIFQFLEIIRRKQSAIKIAALPQNGKGLIHKGLYFVVQQLNDIHMLDLSWI